MVILPVRPVWYCRQQSGGLDNVEENYEACNKLREFSLGIHPTSQIGKCCCDLRRLISALHLGDLDLPLAARRRVRAQEVEVDRRRVRRGGAKIDVN